MTYSLDKEALKAAATEIAAWDGFSIPQEHHYIRATAILERIAETALSVWEAEKVASDIVENIAADWEFDGMRSVYRGRDERKRVAAQITAALSRRAGEQWRPIETAPKDGSLIIAADAVRALPANWIDGRWEAAAGDWEDDPTHWQPLPPLPACTAARDGGIL